MCEGERNSQLKTVMDSFIYCPECGFTMTFLARQSVKDFLNGEKESKQTIVKCNNSTCSLINKKYIAINFPIINLLATGE
jgi:hypothetical protein